MRTPWDRLRQAISFELLGLLIATPLGAWVFDASPTDFGVLVIIGASMATGWNYLFNWLFDHALLRWQGHVRKSVPQRVIHAIAFEAGLTVGFLPVTAWWLGIGLWDALLVDIAFSAFYLVYAFVFTWAYDTLFPVPTPTAATATEDAAA